MCELNVYVSLINSNNIVTHIVLTSPFLYSCQAIVLVLENGSQNCSQMMTDLLRHLFTTALVTPEQFKQGFQRVFGAMSDIVLDVPLAYSTLSSFVEKSIVGGYISKELANEMPQR